jgi:response regulator of citrate/malate metabolism
MVFWSVKDLDQHFLAQLKMWLFIESCVEAEQRTTVLETVTLQLEFLCRVNVFDLKLYAWASRRLCHPKVQVLMLVTVKEQKVVAATFKAQVVDYLSHFFLFEF